MAYWMNILNMSIFIYLSPTRYIIIHLIINPLVVWTNNVTITCVSPYFHILISLNLMTGWIKLNSSPILCLIFLWLYVHVFYFNFHIFLTTFDAYDGNIAIHCPSLEKFVDPLIFRRLQNNSFSFIRRLPFILRYF